MTNITHSLDKAIKGVCVAIIWATLAASQGAAQIGFDVPANGVETFSQQNMVGDHSIPVGVWTHAGGVPTKTVSGRQDLRAYRYDATSLTAAQMIKPIRDALTTGGFDILLDCDADACGGFDFRANVPMIDPPAVFVDLRKFVAMTAIKDDGSAIFVVASRVGPVGYLQIATVTSDDANPVFAMPMVSAVTAPTVGGYVEALHQVGSVILRDLEFESGSSTLGAGPFSSLDEIAAYLNATPDARVVLVGHTDSVGSLAGNMDLSAKRARAVLKYLTQNLGVAAAQLDAQGIGYLSPVATNETPFGREENRRVVAVLILPFK
jgi:outer membrane protein OmpA-like peptidoglycan-associated protein